MTTAKPVLQVLNWKISKGDDWVEVFEFDDGTLRCVGCNTTSSPLACEHVGLAIRGRLDKPELHEIIHIVIQPHPYLEVLVDHSLETHAFCIRGESPTVERPQLSDVLGFLQPGEGRLALWAVVVEWLASQENVRCKSPYHVPREFQNATRAAAHAAIWGDPYSPERLAETYSILSWKECTACLEDNRNLVPKL